MCGMMYNFFPHHIDNGDKLIVTMWQARTVWPHIVQGPVGTKYTGLIMGMEQGLLLSLGTEQIDQLCRYFYLV